MRRRIIEIFCIILAVFTITIGFSAYGNQGSIAGAVADVVLKDDLRITNVTYNTATNSGSSNYAEHGKFTMISSVNLPNASSTVTYNVELTNFGNVTKGIYAITNLPSNLTYSISGYNMRDDVCDSSGSCTLGAKKEFTITIKYATNGFTSTKTTYDLNVIFDFRQFHNLTWTKYNLFYHLGDRETTNSDRMKYSISNDVVTVTATADDGYGFIPYKVDMEAGKTYVFNATSSASSGSGVGSDTTEGYLMKDCGYDYYVHVNMNTPTELKPTQTGTYCLRLDVNKNGSTHTFRNITIGEVVGTSRVAHNEKLSDVSGTLPSISKSGYTYIGYFDSKYRDSPFNYYADAYGDLYNAFGYNQESLWNHYKNQGGPIEGRRVSQYASTDNYVGGKSQYIYGYLKPTTTYTISYDANGGSGAPSSQSKLIDRDLILTSSQPSKTNYKFKGWGESSTATNVLYNSSSTYSTNAAVTLYALWNLNVIENFNGSDNTAGFFNYNAPVETDGDGVFQWQHTGGTWRTNTDDTGDWPWNSSTVSIESTITFTPPVNSTFTFNWGVSSAAFEYIGIRLNITGSDGSNTVFQSTDDASYSSGSESINLTAGVTYSLYVKLMFPSWYDNTFMWLDDFKIVQR